VAAMSMCGPQFAYHYGSNANIMVPRCLVIIDCCIGGTFVDEKFFKSLQKLLLNRFMLHILSNFREFCISYVITFSSQIYIFR
jgi:hypothetical protein